MTESNSAIIPLWEVKSKIKTRKDLYVFISQIYRLPCFNSKAITVEYLQAYLKYPCPIFRIMRENFHPPYISAKHGLTGIDLLLEIEKLLEEKKQCPTGLDKAHIPDIEWLLGVYFFLSPNDELKLFPRSIRLDSQAKLIMDPE